MIRTDPATDAARRGPSARFDDATWIEAALRLMAEGGIDAVRVEPLARTLGVTKGAFYNRFRSRDAFLEALLDYWRRESTVAVIALLGSYDESPGERLHRVLMLPFRRPDVKERARMEMALRIWAHRDRRADAVMKEIDAYRLKYFESVLLANGLAEDEARARAFLVYAYIITDGSLPGDRSEEVRQKCRALLSSDAPRRTDS